jgi:hypothetical protein
MVQSSTMTLFRMIATSKPEPCGSSLHQVGNRVGD